MTHERNCTYLFCGLKFPVFDLVKKKKKLSLTLSFHHPLTATFPCLALLTELNDEGADFHRSKVHH